MTWNRKSEVPITGNTSFGGPITFASLFQHTLTMAASAFNADDLGPPGHASQSNPDASQCPIKLVDLTTTISKKKFMKYAHRLSPDTLELLELSIRHPKYSEIGTVTAVLIHRGRCYSDGMFLEVMDADGELFTIASTLFDKYGQVRSWLVDDEYHKGSGVWGRELNAGRLVFVFCVSVKEPYRTQGVGSWALQQLYASEHIEKTDQLICWPSPIPRPPSEQWVPVFDGIVHFFRKAGYRRIGGTSFFAFSQDPDHPSRKTHIVDDFDPDERFMDCDELFVRRALQDAIHDDTSEKIVQVIRDAHADDPKCIHQPDSRGFRPLFVAVKSNNLHAVRTLLALGISEEDFNSRENGDHITPLEALHGGMRSNREFQEIFAHQLWRGHSDTDLLMEAALKRAMGHPMPATDAEWVVKKKWGCTCDKCFGGWLSPRVLRRIADEADMGYDTAWDTPDMMQMVPRVPLSAELIECVPILCYIPKELWREVYKTFILGYAGVLRAIALLLRRAVPVLPTEATVRAELQSGQIDFEYVRAAAFYFQKGGRVEYALDAVLDSAKNAFHLEGTIMDMYSNDEHYLKLPSCDNDREFEIVRKLMGLDPQRVWGPYSLSAPRTYSDMDSEDEEEAMMMFGEGDTDEDSEDDGDEDGDDGEEDPDSYEGDSDDEDMGMEE
ncbi:hypothetical protein B0H11DRAFT_1183595 [Mycena galericulata]|nr:hypothetical protein B0H11DRAFT_1183595 [Mycena galericulata]